MGLPRCLVCQDGTRHMQLQMQIPLRHTDRGQVEVWGQAQAQKPLKSRYVRQAATPKTVETGYKRQLIAILMQQTQLSVKLWKQLEALL